MFSNKLKTTEFFKKLKEEYSLKFAYEILPITADNKLDKISIFVSQNEKPLGELTLYSDLFLTFDSINIDNLEEFTSSASEDEIYYFLMEQVLSNLAFSSVSVEEYLNCFFEMIDNDSSAKKEHNNYVKEQFKLILIDQKKSINSFFESFDHYFDKNLYDKFSKDLSNFVQVEE